MMLAKPIPIPAGDHELGKPLPVPKVAVKRSISISSIRHISRIPESPPNPDHPLQAYDNSVNQYCSFDCTAFEDSDGDDTFDEDDDDDQSKLSLSIESSSSLASSFQSNCFGSRSTRPSGAMPSRPWRLSLSSSTSPPSLTSLTIKSTSSNLTTHTFVTSTPTRVSSLESISSLKLAVRRPSRTLASNLTESFKSFHSSLRRGTATIAATFNLTPRMTDDVLPQPPVTEEELTTFRDEEDCPTEWEPAALPRFKNRDQRVNSDFLRLYAFDYSARTLGVLPTAHTSSELERLVLGSDLIRQFHHSHNLHKVLNASKDKLWKGVILAPRLDRCPYEHIECRLYVADGSVADTHSLVRLCGTHQPWNVGGARCFKPAGILHGAKKCINGNAPSSGVTRSQYTVKGWCNPRWIAVNS